MDKPESTRKTFLKSASLVACAAVAGPLLLGVLGLRRDPQPVATKLPVEVTKAPRTVPRTDNRI